MCSGSRKRAALRGGGFQNFISRFPWFSWFPQLLVLQPNGFYKNDGNHENDDDSSDGHKKGVECWTCGNHENHRNDEKHLSPGCKPQVPPKMGLETPLPKSKLWASRTVGFSPALPRREGTTKNSCDKDFAELSRELKSAI